MGILHQLLATGIRATAMRMHSGGRRLAEFAFDGVDSTFPFSLATAETGTERVLRARLTELAAVACGAADATLLDSYTTSGTRSLGG